MIKALTRIVSNHAQWLAEKARLRDKRAPASGTTEIWNALRVLNSRLLTSSEPEFTHVREVHEQLRLDGKTSRGYIVSVVPFLCRHNQFKALIEWRDLSFLCKPGKQRNARKLSLMLPLLVTEAHYEQAGQVLAELATKANKGWLNTECVRFAVEQFQRNDSVNEVEPGVTVQFHIAFIKLLDAFNGDWFSRLHDIELINAAIAILSTIDKQNTTHRATVVAALIRHYGLCSGFWCRYERSIEDDDETIKSAHTHWKRVYKALNDPKVSFVEQAQGLLESLAWFHARNNTDAIPFLRDIVACHVNDETPAVIGQVNMMINWLHEHNPNSARIVGADTIWPTFRSSSYVPSANRLELLSDIQEIIRLPKAEPLVVSVVRNEMVMLPHFLTHYRRIGIKGFVFVDNGSSDGTREFLLAQPDVVLYHAESEYRQACYGVAWQQAILGNHCLGRWVVLADADELLVYPGWHIVPLPVYLTEVEQAGANAILTIMVDMYPTGPLESADFSRRDPFQAAPCHDAIPTIEWRLGGGYYSNGVNHLSTLRHRLVENAPPNAFTSQKIALFRYQPWLRFSAGLHSAANVELADETVIFAHFKYHSGFMNKVVEEVERGQHYNGAEEYRYYLKHLEALNEAITVLESSSAVTIPERLSHGRAKC